MCALGSCRERKQARYALGSTFVDPDLCERLRTNKPWVNRGQRELDRRKQRANERSTRESRRSWNVCDTARSQLTPSIVAEGPPAPGSDAHQETRNRHGVVFAETCPEQVKTAPKGAGEEPKRAQRCQNAPENEARRRCNCRIVVRTCSLAALVVELALKQSD